VGPSSPQSSSPRQAHQLQRPDQQHQGLWWTPLLQEVQALQETPFLHASVEDQGF
jgi:hypothetical protein